jgi:hypothetical protein
MVVGSAATEDEDMINSGLTERPRLSMVYKLGDKSVQGSCRQPLLTVLAVVKFA